MIDIFQVVQELGLLASLVDAVVSDGPRRQQVVRIGVPVACGLQVRPLVAVSQVLLAQAPQGVALLHSLLNTSLLQSRKLCTMSVSLCSVMVSNFSTLKQLLLVACLFLAPSLLDVVLLRNDDHFSGSWLEKMWTRRL